jgi:type II secretory pathway pseudopilin PulG
MDIKILKRLGRRGDTIVEVLVAIVVVSGTLGTAFSTMNSGTQGTRAAHERAEALKLVETQVELLKAAHENRNANVNGRVNAFCLEDDTSGIIVHESFSTPQSVGSLDGQDLSDYDANCRDNSIPAGYNLSISEASSGGPDAGKYTVRARWENINGRTRDQIEIKYKVPR